MPISLDPEQRAKQISNLTPGSPGRPKGSRNWSSVVQNLLDDEDLFKTLVDNMDRKPAWLEKVGTKTLMQAITTAQAIKAMGGSHFSAEWLRKTGWGDKIDITSNGETLKSEPLVVSVIRSRDNTLEGEVVPQKQIESPDEPTTRNQTEINS
jgi:hypothetical protein